MTNGSPSPGAGVAQRRGSLLGGVASMVVVLAAVPGRANDSSETMSRADTLEVRLDAPDTVKVGEPVQVTLTISNRSGRRLTLHLQGREIVFDITVSREDGIPVWRRLAGQAVQAILRVEELEAGGEIVLRATWSQQDATGKPVRPGTYYLQGSIPTDRDPLVTPRRQLRIQEAPD